MNVDLEIIYNSEKYLLPRDDLDECYDVPISKIFENGEVSESN